MNATYNKAHNFYFKLLAEGIASSFFIFYFVKVIKRAKSAISKKRKTKEIIF